MASRLDQATLDSTPGKAGVASVAGDDKAELPVYRSPSQKRPFQELSGEILYLLAPISLSIKPAASPNIPDMH